LKGSSEIHVEKIFLAPGNLVNFLTDDDWSDKPAAESLFQTLRELGMSPEGMDNMAKALAGFAREAKLRYGQARLEYPGRIRIFCQKKI
jgi:hypothetical protein